jgi:hypothetical protein
MTGETMSRFSVTFMLDADDLDAAQKLVGTWTVTPGVTLFGLVQLASLGGPPVPIPPTGNVASALATAAASPAPGQS